MNNLRGIGLMVLAMATFTISDMFIKLASTRLPVGQILIVLGLGGTLVFAALARRRGDVLFSRAVLHPAVLARNTSEVLGTFGVVMALALTPLSQASAIFQATPLLVTLGAALIFRETVGWRRWSAIALGLTGVLIIIRPGTEGFDANSLFAVLGVLGLSGRDLSTRAVPPGISTVQLAAYGFAVVAPLGAIVLAGTGGALWPDPQEWLYLIAMVASSAVAYFCITLAMRVGEISAVTPFRYTRLIFALAVGYLVFGEIPDGAMYLGAALIIGSGLYTIARERRLHRRAMPR